MPELAYINGRTMPIDQATIPVEDRGYQFGDAVYELIALYHGRLFALEEHLDRLERADCGHDSLPSTRKTGHEVRLDQPGHNPQLRFEKLPVDIDRRLVDRGLAKVVMGTEVSPVVVNDAIALRDVRAKKRHKLLALVGAVDSGSDEDGYVLTGNSGLFEPPRQ